MNPDRLRRAGGAMLCAAVFFALSVYHLNRPGLQADEALFAQGVWENGLVESFTRVFGWHVPLMQMPYLGALKAILYQPVFAVFGVSAAVVRLPMVVCGAATVALTFLLLWKLRGERTAWTGGALLACDPTFLFTTRCDWGPVAIERLLCVGGVLLFTREGRARWWGALLFGLALWNKTTFVWTLMGLGAGVLICFRPQVRRVRVVALAAMLACFALGAYPWIRYNVRSRGGTVSATARFDASDLAGKTRLLGRSLEGSALYGYLMREGEAGPWPRANVTVWLLLASVVIAIAARDGLALFFGVTAAVAWLAMAFTRDGGASAHHAVLLWPWPHCLIALAAARWRLFTAAAALGVLLSAGVVVRHYVLLDRYGADTPWSDAIYPLAERVAHEQPRGVFAADWGIREPLMLFSQGRVPFEVAFHRHLPPEEFAARAGWIFAGHVDEREAMAGVNAVWREVPGFRRVTLATIPDAQGVPVFELFRFEATSSPGAATDQTGHRE